MITYLFYGLLISACFLAFSNWRNAVYAAIFLDFLRDPVRKLDEEQSVVITVSILMLWVIIAAMAYTRSEKEIRGFFALNPKLGTAFRFLVVATIPGTLISVFLYAQGLQIAVLGLVSYLAPLAGIILGALFPRGPEEVNRLLRFYCVVNGIALIGVLAEYLQWQLPALGGLRGMQWIRYSAGDVVNLIGGFYRSPDIMGMHAAQVAMFSLILTGSRSGRIDFKWLAFVAFACLCLLLSGRRKMLGMPMVFCGAFAVLAYIRGMRQLQFVIVPALSLFVGVAGIYFVINEDFVADEYANYASTLFTDGANRSSEVIYGSIFSTLEQTGVIGSGIGSATQGNYHLVEGRIAGSWQEDGASRIVRELGVWGVVFVLLAAFSLVQSIRGSISRVIPNSTLAFLQLALIAVAIANLGSFLISHQQYSGDPPSAIIVLMVLGMAFAIPRMQSS